MVYIKLFIGQLDNFECKGVMQMKDKGQGKKKRPWTAETPWTVESPV